MSIVACIVRWVTHVKLSQRRAGAQSFSQHLERRFPSVWFRVRAIQTAAFWNVLKLRLQIQLLLLLIHVVDCCKRSRRPEMRV